MKKWIFSAALLIMTANCIQAQEVFDTLREKASHIVNTNDVNDYNTKINYFYLTALNYMKMKASPQDATQWKILDEQALAMQAYVSEFIGWMSRTQDADLRRRGIQLFIDTSAEHPFFNDKDTETTQSFVSDSDYLTPFSLDTDWVAAHAAIKEALGKLK